MARSKGAGGITRLDDAPKARCRRWRLKVTRNGKVRTRRFTGTYAQAEAALAAFEAELAAPRSELTLGEYADLWLDRRRRGGEIAAQTLAKDERNVGRVKHVFGGERLADLGRAGIADGLLDMRHGDNPTGAELSGTTMNKVFVTMKSILKQATLDGLMERNPMDTLEAPRKDTKEKRAASPDDVRRLLAMLEARPVDAHTVAVRIMVLAGLRRSEVVGLEWRDLRGGVIRVRRSVAELTGEVKPPKSAAGVRSVPVMPQLASALEAWRLAQADQLSFLGMRQRPETPVVTSAAGTRMAAQNMWRWWHRTKGELGMDCTLHELRHTFLTMLANSGAPAQALKSIAGWSSIGMANVYVHADERANEEAVLRLSGAFGGGTFPKVPSGTFERERRATNSNEEAAFFGF